VQYAADQERVGSLLPVVVRSKAFPIRIDNQKAKFCTLPTSCSVSERKELTCGYKTFFAHVRRLQHQAAATTPKAITPEKRKFAKN
jgi:hypothetical protein